MKKKNNFIGYNENLSSYSSKSYLSVVLSDSEVAFLNKIEEISLLSFYLLFFIYI